MSSQRMRQVVTASREWAAKRNQQATVMIARRRGGVVLQEAFGTVAPQPDSAPATVDTLFPLASLTKPITATAAMILVEEGRLGLHFPVSFYISEFSGDGKDAVTAFHLLTHTSGLRDEDVHTFAQRRRARRKAQSGGQPGLPQIAVELADCYGAPLWKRPGEEMSYCNFGYDLLGDLVQRVSGTPLPSFVAARIFQPLGMKDSFYGLPDELASRTATREAGDLRSWFDSNEHRHTPWASGCAFSTARDLAVLGQAFLNQGSYGDARILAAPTVQAMTSNQIPGIGARNEWRLFREASWGLGWVVNCRTKNDPAFGECLLSARAFGHGGAGGIYLWVDPALDLVAVYLNVHPAHTEKDVREDYYGASLFINSVVGSIVEAADG